ncbi:hypothetical protein EN804_32725 [Mesorhizobium sp. M8A.F.Ca.ET.161.01.1.1]|nr:hypothetical protein EN804_32725 [Mesorhizobium sp. M8A.F.Ca.ET.161.01.1.1]TGV35310.1 hypothetical protein EN785_32850 [Mesorhizobium sp. M8A.F.Ca.ET.142.01.1.1]
MPKYVAEREVNGKSRCGEILPPQPWGKAAIGEATAFQGVVRFGGGIIPMWQVLLTPVDLYCERTGRELWSEPVNALTNLAFIAAGRGSRGVGE